jgi:hypothetical protein
MTFVQKSHAYNVDEIDGMSPDFMLKFPTNLPICASFAKPVCRLPNATRSPVNASHRVCSKKPRQYVD